MREITPKLRFELQIAVEKIIIDRWMRKPEEGQSSRIFADEVVDLVLDTVEGKRPVPSGDELKPWLAFAIKKNE